MSAFDATCPRCKGQGLQAPPPPQQPFAQQAPPTPPTWPQQPQQYPQQPQGQYPQQYPGGPQPGAYPPQYQNPGQWQGPPPNYNNDAPNFLFAFIGFCFPLIGLILWAVTTGSTPQKAMSALKGAGLSFAISVGFFLLLVILGSGAPHHAP